MLADPLMKKNAGVEQLLTILDTHRWNFVVFGAVTEV